ncbi:anti-sigma factor family protein [Thalassospira mesophila]|uniref:anti-sigma factor family protein n=1 Tax=Thalassospira mesophila TaxID=1293891 RepID=UPI000A1DB0FF|nr:anti-sigma factor [Thalassospira mesophila]
MTRQDNDDIGEDDLHAYVDGHLTADRHHAVEQWLADNPDAAAEVANWQTQNNALRDLFPLVATADDPLIDQQARIHAQSTPDETMTDDGITTTDTPATANTAPDTTGRRSRRANHPGRLQPFVNMADGPIGPLAPPAPGFYSDETLSENASPRRARYPFRQMAAAAMVFIAGGIGGAAIMETAIPKPAPLSLDYVQTLPEASRAGYGIYASEVRHPVEVYADQKDHLVGWLGKRLGISFSAPDLGTQGFHLVGGRLVPFAGKPGALLMYEDTTGQRLTLLVGHDPDNRSTGFRYQTSGNIETFYWVDGAIGYALSGEIDKAHLEDVAMTIYQQLGT